MRVLTLVDSLHPAGGIESFLMNVFHALDLNRFKLDLCYTDEKPGAMAADAAKLGINIWGCRQQLDNFRFSRRFSRELKARGPYDVVHTHVGHFGGAALSVARRHAVPVRIAHYHNTVEGHRNDWKRRLYTRWIRRQVLNSATAIVGCAWAALRYHLPDDWEHDPRMTVIRYGIPVEAFAAPSARDDVRREFAISPTAAVVGHVGRFVWQKNHARLIQAARLVVDRRPEIIFLLVGNGILMDQCRALVEQLDLSANIIFAGLRKDVPRLLGGMDIFTLPSITEGHPLTLIEAQAAGLPVVASDIPSAAETVAPPFRSYLRPATDIPGLAEAILRLLDQARIDPTLRNQARDFGSKFTIEATRAAMLAAWKFEGAVAPPDPSAEARSISAR